MGFFSLLLREEKIEKAVKKKEEIGLSKNRKTFTTKNSEANF